MVIRKSTTRSRSKASRLTILETREFPGLYSYPKPQQIPRGAAQSSLNFLTRYTWVETRGGYHPLGTEVSGSGKILGIITAHKWDGSEIIFKTTLVGALQYFDNTFGWLEVGGTGANILAGAMATGENIYFSEYFSPAGAQLWVSSPSTDLIKIMTANPTSYLSQYNTSKNFKGRIRIIQNAMWLWHYTASSSITNVVSQSTNATVQRSYIDAEIYATKTDTAVVVTVTGPTISGTVSKNSIANATIFGVIITDVDSGETFSEAYMGILVGSAGGSGTIDYSSGKFTLTPNVAPVPSPNINATYSYEDSTNNGIADFSKSSTRQAAQGVSWLQNVGGDILDILPYNGSQFVLHQRNIWQITPTADDSGATNIIYRSNMSLSSERGSISTSEGIYFIDTTIATRPYVALIEYNAFASQILPTDISSNILDLSPYVFDKCVAFEWSDFIIFGCRTTDSTENNRMLLYNKKLSSSKKRIYDIVDFYSNCLTILAGQLIAGDPISNNAYKLFDGFDDNGGIPNFTWTGNIDDHGIAGLKQTKKLWIEGYIAVNQSSDVYVQLDANNAVKVGSISGSGKYVDQGQSVTIGSLQVGMYPVGGPSNTPIGYHYLIQITINSARYKYFTIQFQPTGIGYFMFQMYANYDIRINVDKLPLKYRNITGNGNAGGGSSPVLLITGIFTEQPQGAVNGVNKVYTVNNPIGPIFALSINGEPLTSIMYTVSGQQITFIDPLDASLAGTPFEIVYAGTNPTIHTEKPQGNIDGVNTVYTVSSAITNVFTFRINGTSIPSGLYSISGNTITFFNPISAGLTGLPFEIVYD